MEDLENTTNVLSEKYKVMHRRLDPDDIKIPIYKLRNMIIGSGILTVISGAVLAYAMFPKTVESIINYFTQRPF